MELESMSEEFLGRIHFSEHQFNLSSDDIKPVHSAPYRAGPTARRATVVRINGILPESVIEQATTK